MPMVRDVAIIHQAEGRQLSPEGWSQLSCCSIQQMAGPVIPEPVKSRAGTVQPSDFHTCGSYGPLCYHQPQRSLPTPAAAVPWTQTWPSAPALSQMSPWPLRQHRAPRSVWPCRQHGPRTMRWSQVADQILVILMAIGGNSNHGHQLRPWLL